ncbi:hypothetical protein D3C72_2508160 [compost metagenome]
MLFANVVYINIIFRIKASLSAVNNLAAVHMNNLAAYIGRVAGGQIHIGRCQLLRLSGTLHRLCAAELADLLRVEG